MTVVTTVFFGIRSEMIENVLSTATNLGLTTKRIAVFRGRYHFMATGEDAEPAIDKFCTYLNNHQITWSVLRMGAYSEEELQSAPLLVLRVNRAARCAGAGQQDRSTWYYPRGNYELLLSRHHRWIEQELSVLRSVGGERVKAT